MSFKEEMLITLFGGGTADYDMLEKCNYDFEEILHKAKDFCSIEEMNFDIILLGAICLYKDNIKSRIDEKIIDLKNNIKYLENKMECCVYDKYDEMELIDNREDLDALENLCPSDDIEEFTNYLDTHIFINDEETRAVYKRLLTNEIDAENDEIGFVALDLD